MRATRFGIKLNLGAGQSGVAAPLCHRNPKPRGRSPTVLKMWLQFYLKRLAGKKRNLARKISTRQTNCLTLKYNYRIAAISMR
jgi:hypothetical protein